MIQTTGLAYRYPHTQSIRFDDCKLATGEVLLLKGRSGSGKSTWLALACALLTPSEGEIVVAGQSMQALGKAGKSNADAWRGQTIGFLPQSLHLSPVMSVQQNLELAYFARGLKVDAARIDSVLQQLDIAELASRKPSQLSGGQAQRVALARAILFSPAVVLADEPTASLDDISAEDAIQCLLQNTLNPGSALVIATHDARVANLLAREGLSPQVLELGLSPELIQS